MERVFDVAAMRVGGDVVVLILFVAIGFVNGRVGVVDGGSSVGLNNVVACRSVVVRREGRSERVVSGRAQRFVWKCPVEKKRSERACEL